MSALASFLSWMLIASIYSLADAQIEDNFQPVIKTNNATEQTWENGQTANEINDNLDDAKTAKKLMSGPKRTLDATVYFGMPFLIGLFTFVGLSARGGGN